MIEALDLSNELKTDPDKMNMIIEGFFEKKFNTSFNAEEIIWTSVNHKSIGSPEHTFSDCTSEAIMRPITLEELSKNIGELKSDKAEGLDGISDDMLKNTDNVARAKIVEMFNNIMVGGQVPASWKDGDVVLILKKPPQSDINN